jgi:flagellar hook-associated protein 2
MAGIQVSGLSSGINWQSIITELVTADSAGINAVKAQQAKVNLQGSALGSLGTDLTNLSSAVFTLEDPTTYGGVVAGSTTANSTWVSTASNGTQVGNTVLNVSQLASTAQLQGASGISSKLNSSSDVSTLTLANLGVAQAVTAGTFTVDGHAITLTTSESLQDAFTAISTATSGVVTGAYDPSTDKVTLTDSSSTPIVLGAANDTSNFLAALKLANNGTAVIHSSSALGAVQLGKPIVSSDLKTALTGQDGSGNGAFTVNGVTINYNINTSSLSTVLGQINSSSAGVTASYDAGHDRILLTNTLTGDTGIGVSDTTGNLLAALGVASSSSPTLVRGTNALYTVNGGSTQSSASNTLSGTALGVQGLTVTVDSKDTQTIAVQNDPTAVQTAIQTFITNFNALETDIKTDTKITTGNGTVVTSVLSGNHDVSDWGSALQATAFSAGSGLTGTAITSLDALGIDFDGTTGQLKVADAGKLTQVLNQNPTAVQAFFRTAHTGFGSVMNKEITDIISQNTSEVQNFQSQSKDLATHITSMQTELDAEQQRLETEFQAMETALANLQNQTSALTGLSGTSGTSAATSATNNFASAFNNAGSSSSTTSGTGSSGTGTGTGG